MREFSVNAYTFLCYQVADVLLERTEHNLSHKASGPALHLISLNSTTANFRQVTPGDNLQLKSRYHNRLSLGLQFDRFPALAQRLLELTEAQKQFRQ